MSRILVVEDEPAIAELVAINLRHAGFEVAIAADAEQAQAEIDARAARPGDARLDAARAVRPAAGAALARAAAHARAAGDHADRQRATKPTRSPGSTPAPTTT